jgi:hypothetical protein
VLSVPAALYLRISACWASRYTKVQACHHPLAAPTAPMLQVVAVIDPEMQVTQVAANPWDESALALASPGGVRTCRVDVNTGSVRSSPMLSTQVGRGLAGMRCSWLSAAWAIMGQWWQHFLLDCVTLASPCGVQQADCMLCSLSHARSQSQPFMHNPKPQNTQVLPDHTDTRLTWYRGAVARRVRAETLICASLMGASHPCLWLALSGAHHLLLQHGCCQGLSTTPPAVA